MVINYEKEILKIMKTLDDNGKKELLDFVKSVSNRPNGEPVKQQAKGIRETEDSVVDDEIDMNLDEA